MKNPYGEMIMKYGNDLPQAAYHLWNFPKLRNHYQFLFLSSFYNLVILPLLFNLFYFNI